MGLDNGFIVCSKRRKITKDMLPAELKYPFPDEDDDGVEIIYWRKNWGLRNSVLQRFGTSESGKYDGYLDTVDDIFDLIRIIISFMDKDKWEDEGRSIWKYEEILPTLQDDIINLCIMAAFMKNNQDVYLAFYDSY